MNLEVLVQLGHAAMIGWGILIIAGRISFHVSKKNDYAARFYLVGLLMILLTIVRQVIHPDANPAGAWLLVGLLAFTGFLWAITVPKD